MRPRPSDDPVMNTRATSHLLLSRRPIRLTIPNGQPGKATPRATAAVRVGGREALIAPPTRAWQARPSNKQEEPIYKNDEVDFRPSIRADRGSYLPGGTNRAHPAGEGR